MAVALRAAPQFNRGQIETIARFEYIAALLESSHADVVPFFCSI